MTEMDTRKNKAKNILQEPDGNKNRFLKEVNKQEYQCNASILSKVLKQFEG